MLRNVEPGGKLSGRACPSCGCRGNFAGHGSYSRSLATERGEERIRVRRAMCRSCGATHALLPLGVVPYRLHSDAVCVAVVYEWSAGTPAREVRSRLRMPETTRRRVLARTRARLCSLLSRGAARGELAAPIEAAGVGGIRRMHAEAHGTALAENRRFANARRRVPLAATLPT